jgi:hypothetical protein
MTPHDAIAELRARIEWLTSEIDDEAEALEDVDADVAETVRADLADYMRERDALTLAIAALEMSAGVDEATVAPALKAKLADLRRETRAEIVLIGFGFDMATGIRRPIVRVRPSERAPFIARAGFLVWGRQ